MAENFYVSTIKSTSLSISGGYFGKINLNKTKREGDMPSLFV
jgi:hypothetical protein